MRPAADGQVLLVCGRRRDRVARTAMIARVLRAAGQQVVLGGADFRTAASDGEFPVHPLPASDALFAEAGPMWVDRALRHRRDVLASVAAEVALLERVGPRLVVSDGRPTIALAAVLHGTDLWDVIPPGLGSRPEGGDRLAGAAGAREDEVLASCALHLGLPVRPVRRMSLVADLPQLWGATAANGRQVFVGPLLGGERERDVAGVLGWNGAAGPLIHCNLPGDVNVLEQLVAHRERLARLRCRLVFGVCGGSRRDGLPGNVRVVDRDAWQLGPDLDAYVGTVDVAQIYRLLRLGVPVIGCPQYAEEAGLVDRLSALRLGARLVPGS